jgi:multisubunit Na+/H+ antiporter MnhF subunit
MIIFINLTILICLTLVIIKFISSNDSYQKIIGFYFVFTKLIILILFNSISKFEHIADIILLLFLVELAAVLFLLFNQKTIEK